MRAKGILDPSTARGAFGLGVLLGTLLGVGMCGLALWRSPGSGAGPILFPVSGARGRNLAGDFQAPRGDRSHGAVDIFAPRGTPVLAVSDGTLEQLSTSALGGRGLYYRATAGGWCFYYAHLERYAPGLKPQQALARGRVLGYVGSSGNASVDAPHLHFAVLRVEDDEACSDGVPVDPHPLLAGSGKPTPPPSASSPPAGG